MPRAKVERRVEILTLAELVRVPEERDTDNWLFGDFQFLDRRTVGRLSSRCLLGLSAILTMTSSGQNSCAKRLGKGSSIWLTDCRRRNMQDIIFRPTANAIGATRTSSARTSTTTMRRSINASNHCLSGRGDNGDLRATRVKHRLRGQSCKTASAALSPVIYGTIRLIERDEESFLAWAREPWACIIFNLHLEHTSAGFAVSGDIPRLDRPGYRIPR